VGADIEKVRVGIGSDSRIGYSFMYPGAGYGGSCFPKDVQALAKTASEYSYDFKILKSVMKVNGIQKGVLLKKIRRHFKNDLSGKTFAVWGLAFKPNTDDIREAPALDVIRQLTSRGAAISAFDPEAMGNVRRELEVEITYAENQYAALTGADALIICTEWNEFRTPDFDKIIKGLNAKVIFDGRNLYDPATMESLGFYYDSVGRITIN